VHRSGKQQWRKRSEFDLVAGFEDESDGHNGGDYGEVLE
jgi:hypothetical protein